MWIRPSARRVTSAGTTVELTPRELDLLLFSARHSDVAFTCDDLMDRVWQLSFFHRVGRRRPLRTMTCC
jgi:DNA-binding response OmpR family regulator